MNLNNAACESKSVRPSTKLESIIDSLNVNNENTASFINSMNDELFSRLDAIANKLNYSDYYKNNPKPDPVDSRNIGSDIEAPTPEGSLGDLQRISKKAQQLNSDLRFSVFSRLQLFIDFLETQI